MRMTTRGDVSADARALSKAPRQAASWPQTAAASQRVGNGGRWGFTSGGFVRGAGTFVPRWFPGTTAVPKLRTDVPRRTEFLIRLHEYSQ